MQSGPNLEEAARYYEQAVMIITKLRKENKKLTSQEEQKYDRKLDKMYLKLIEIYLETNQKPQAK